jgi:hypothetical protein
VIQETLSSYNEKPEHEAELSHSVGVSLQIECTTTKKVFIWSLYRNAYIL